MGDFAVPGAIDLHCHFHPDDLGKGLGTPHSGVHAADVIREASDSGHAGVVLKSHSFASAQLAAVLDAAEPGIRVFGGICTDHFSGGLNVMAVESALNQGARIVWLPTIHGRQDIEAGNRIGFLGRPIDCLDEDGALVDEVHEIAALTKQAGAVLATGHISAAEHHAVVKAFASRQNVLVTHAGEELGGPHLNRDQIVALADLGAIIEFTALGCQDIPSLHVKGTPPSNLARLIAAVGPERCTLSSDYGSGPDFGRPGHGFVGFLEELWKTGVSEAAITSMARTNPGRLVGIEGW
jgi:hypothetical protein